MMNLNLDITEVLKNRQTAASPEAAFKDAKDLKKARDAAEDFEAFFLSQMFEHMFNGLEPDPIMGGGNAEKIFRSFMTDEYGKMMAKSGGIGIADQVMNYVIRTQEATPVKGV